MMLLSEMLSALEFMRKELSVLIKIHGREAPCSHVDADTVDAPFLRTELKVAADTELDELLANVEEACVDTIGLIEEFGADALCGNFDLG